MSTTTDIIIREFKDSKFQVFDGDLLLACFGSKTAAEEYAQVSSSNNAKPSTSIHD